MISKSLFKQLALIIILSISFTSQAQEVDLNYINLQTIIFNNLNDETSFYEGEVNLKNNTSLTGLISINHKRNGKYITIIKNNDECHYISNQEIYNVSLLNKDNKSETQTSFLQINEDGKLYRLVYQNNDGTSVYDTSTKPFNNLLIGEVIVKENNELYFIFDFWTSGPKKDLINYINERDGKAYKRRHFKSLDTLFACL